MEPLIKLALFGIMLAVYFLPALWSIGKRNSGAIFALNLFLGWTFIGWVGAFIWALMDKDVIKTKPQMLKVSMCPYCEIETRTYNSTIPLTGKAVLRCTECNGIKD